MSLIHVSKTDTRVNDAFTAIETDLGTAIDTAIERTRDLQTTGPNDTETIHKRLAALHDLAADLLTNRRRRTEGFW